MNILVHTSFIGTTGYANHARSFFCALNKFHNVKVRNLTIGSGWRGYSKTPHDNEPYITDEMKNMLILQTLNNNDGTRSDFPLYNNDEKFKADIHIILNDMNNHYFYDNYDGYKIAYNVWESTRYPDDFFKRLFYFDEVWIPTQWQYDSLIEQGYPKEKLTIVPEGVDINTFKPVDIITLKDKFKFLLFGRWDYRKSTTEIIKTFNETFKDNDNVELVCSVENSYANDGMKSTKERLKHYNLENDKINILKFPSREEYVNYLQQGDVYVSCSRSEGWGLPLIESMACGIPSIYSNWGGQLQFADNKGIPVNISHLRPANIGDKDTVGEYCEPDYNDLSIKMLDAYNNYDEYKKKSIEESKLIHDEFNWEKVAKDASEILNKRIQVTENTSKIISKNTPEITESFVFVTTGDIGYMPVIEKLVKSLNEFSKSTILVYGVDCDVPFDSPNMIKRRIEPQKHSIHDKWYWKQHACIESLKEAYNHFVWIDGDVVVNYNIDNINKQFSQIENYPISDIHIQEEFFGNYVDYDNTKKSQLFNQNLCELLNVNKSQPYMHICFYIYNKECKWWFNEILKQYKSVDLKEYKKYYLWNDEGIDNALRWKYGFKKHLPVSNFDTSSYDGDNGNTNQTLNQFYTFWNETGPKNFNRIYGYQFIPIDKSNIIYFHGNKDGNISDKMIEFITLKRDNNFYQSEYFYTDVYNFENFGEIKGIEGSTMNVADKYGWQHAIYHEIYNLEEYYKYREKKINKGDIVVDLGGNMGIFNRWAYSEGASKVISFEPDKRYFKLLELNADPRSILFNAAMSDSIGTINLYECEHYGGSNIFGTIDDQKGHPVRTYSLDYLFETGLIEKIDFLKVDVEGAEHMVFNGISDNNLMKINTIAMEYHNSFTNFDDGLRERFIKRLNNLGFNSYLVFLGNDNAAQMIYFSK